MSMAQDQDLSAVMAASGVKTFTLAFMLSSGPGQIGWGGVGTIDDDGLPSGSSMLTQIQSVQQAGGNVIISFGGANGTEPALVASSAAQLQAEYQSVLTRYNVNSLDFDIEGGAVADRQIDSFARPGPGRVENRQSRTEPFPSLCQYFRTDWLPTGKRCCGPSRPTASTPT